MKKLVFFYILISFAYTAFTQIKQPVEWSFFSKKINPTSYELILTAIIEDGWHLYSQSTPDGGPIPTTVTFFANPLVGLQGSTRETGKLEQHFEKLFGVRVKQYSNKVDFVQTVTIKAGIKTSVRGSVEYMVCNNKECLPPVTKKFTITLN